MYEGHAESKECLRTQSSHLFSYSQSLVSGVQCDVEKLPQQLYIGPFHVVSAEIAVAIILYSLNLAPSGFFLYPKMKEHLAGKLFTNDEDLKDAVVTWLNNQAATWYEEGIHKLVPRYDK